MGYTLTDLASAAEVWRDEPDALDVESRLLDILLHIWWINSYSDSDLASAVGISEGELSDLLNRGANKAWGRLATVWEDCEVVARHPDRLSGAWEFRGTRVPVDALFANLESGATIEQFCEWFPAVDIRQVRVLLDHLRKTVAARATAA